MESPSSKRGRGGDDEYGHLSPLFDELARLDWDDPRRAEIRDRLVTGYLPLAEHIAQRYSGKGVATEDLLQVGTIGLIHAVDRFDPGFGSNFLSYAVPTVMGEVRRYFRDATWPMRVPRRLQELRISINEADEALAQRLGHTASRAELALVLGMSEAQIAEGMEVRQVYRSLPLDAPIGADDDRPTLAESLGEEDADLELVDNHESLVPLIRELPVREQRILALRFFESKTQTEIADAVGISQMHVSRLLTKTLDELRAGLLTSA